MDRENDSFPLQPPLAHVNQHKLPAASEGYYPVHYHRSCEHSGWESGREITTSHKATFRVLFDIPMAGFSNQRVTISTLSLPQKTNQRNIKVKLSLCSIH
jgi:hypothetical protein